MKINIDIVLINFMWSTMFEIFDQAKTRVSRDLSHLSMKTTSYLIKLNADVTNFNGQLAFLFF